MNVEKSGHLISFYSVAFAIINPCWHTVSLTENKNRSRTLSVLIYEKKKSGTETVRNLEFVFMKHYMKVSFIRIARKLCTSTSNCLVTLSDFMMVLRACLYVIRKFHYETDMKVHFIFFSLFIFSRLYQTCLEHAIGFTDFVIRLFV